MKTKIKVSIFIFIIFGVFMAGNTTDQLTAELEKKLETASVEERVDLLNQLAKINISNSPQKSIDYARQALTAAEKAGSDKGKANALRSLGSASRVLGKSKESVAYFQESAAIFESLKDIKGVCAVYHDVGITYYYTGDYTNALEYINKALNISEELKLKPGIASCRNVLGIIYDDQGNFDQALDNYLAALRIYEEIGDRQGYAILINNVGIVYKKLQRYDEALDYYNKALQVERELDNREGIARALNNIGNIYDARLDRQKALEHYLQALEIKRKIGNQNEIASTLGNIGMIYTYLEKFDKALECQDEALQIHRKTNDKKGISQSLKNLGKLYAQQRLFEKARSHYEQALKIAQELSDKVMIHDIYLNLSDLYAAKENYKEALAYYKLLAATKDDIMNKESNEKIAELQTKYESEKKEKEIALLEKNNEILKKNSKIQKLTRDAFIVGFILILIIALLLLKKYLHLFAFWKKKNYIGHYRILDKIGSGGMGIVYKATHVMDPSKSVAIKVIREEYSKDPTQRKRFMNEALLVDQIDHPHIVKVYERGEYNQNLFIAMELLEGQSLAEIIQTGNPIPLPDCLHIMEQLVQTMVKVHAKGIIHRDLKPENIILIKKDEENYFVKLLDFGLAKNQTLTRLTESGEILGTINYLPPERITRQEFSPASDVYSLGVVFYEMLTLEKPFMGEVPIDIIKQILEKQPLEPAAFRPDIPAELSTFVLRMMDKEPANRPGEETLLKTLSNFLLPTSNNYAPFRE